MGLQSPPGVQSTKSIVTLVIAGLTMVVLFQNCGVEQPRVENASLSSAMSPASHQALPANAQCSSCHEPARPILRTTSHNFNHRDAAWASQECSHCHSVKSTWGITWAQGQFSHDPYPSACMDCHQNQMPKVQILVQNDPLRPFNHTAGVECVTCHTSTAKYDTLADFRPAFAQPSGLVGSKTFTAPVIPVSFNGTQMIRAPAANQTFRLEVDHGQDQVANLACTTCHSPSATGAGLYRGALFHQNIAANPTACTECHVNARPLGAVGDKGYMRHEAVAWDSTAIGSVARGSISIVSGECSSCHLNTSSMPQAGQPPMNGSMPFSGASFHLNTPSTSLASCLDCHAHSRPMGSAAFTDPVWRGKTNVGAPPFTTFDLARHAPNVDCATCHKAPGVAASTPALWAPGYFQHTSANVNCLNCHTAAGVTSQSHVGFTSNCVTCHQGATGQFPNPVIADWKVNVTGNRPTGVVGERVVANSVKCLPVLGSTPTCTPTNPNTIVKGYDHLINSNNVSCQNCHGTNAPTSANGKFHTPPVGLGALWTPPAAGDLAGCLSCHDPLNNAPTTVVSVKALGIIGTNINVATGAAPFSGVNHSHPLVAGQQCSQCHTAPAPGAASLFSQAQKLHAKFSPAQLTSCKDCHYKRMPSGLMPRRNQVAYKGTPKSQNFTHSSTTAIPSVTAQECASCHQDAGASWTTSGRVSFHNRVLVTGNCNLCHVAPGGMVTSSTSGVSFDHGTVANIGDCASCHRASVSRVAARIPTAIDWDGATAAPATYTIPAHTANGITVPGYTGTHSSNTNCTACHGTGNYKVITDFDHQGLPAGENSCVSCHLGSKASVSAYIAATSGITMSPLGNRHHPTSIFNGKNTSCVGCHTLTRGATTFNNVNGIVFPTVARAAYVAVGCGTVNGTTYSCHEGNQRVMRVPTTTGISGAWK